MEGKIVYFIRERFEASVKTTEDNAIVIEISQNGKNKKLEISLSDFKVLMGNFKLLTMCMVNSIPEEFNIYGDQWNFATGHNGALLNRLMKSIIESVEEEFRRILHSIEISFVGGSMVLANKGSCDEYRFQETDYRMLYALRQQIGNQIYKC